MTPFSERLPENLLQNVPQIAPVTPSSSLRVLRSDLRTSVRPFALAGITGAIAVALSGCASMSSVDASTALNQANAAMGGTTLKSIQFDANGTGGIFGQAFEPGMAWPVTKVSSLTRVMDFETGSLRQDIAQSRAEPTGGGALPLLGTGEQRATSMLNGTSAWNMVGPAPAASPLALSGRIHDLWTSPHGVIKAALQNNASARSVTENGKKLTAVSFARAGHFTATAFINADNLVERVDSVQPHPVAGDTAATTWYADYKTVDGVKFPMWIRQNMGGFEVLNVAVTEVKPNVSFNAEVPALVSAFAERVAAEKVADGVWYMAGGSHHSVAIEMRDHMIVVESPLYDGRAALMLAEVKKLSNKPIRYVINSHHHFDHAGGLRTAAAEGAELVTSAMAKPYFERTLANPNTVAPDALQKSGKPAKVTAVDTKRVFSDGSRNVEVHFIEGSVHASGFNMVYLPQEKLLIEADAFTPGAPNSPPPVRVNDNHVNLVQNMERLKLDVARILPLHGRVVPVADLYTAIGRKP